MENLEAEIKAAIEKNLPNQIGKALQERLAKADVIDSQNATLSKQLVDKNTTISEYAAKESKYNELNALKLELDKRQADVELAERNKAVFEANLKAVEAEKRATEAVNFVGMVFKSPIYRKLVSEYDNYNTQYNNGINELKRTGGGKTEEIRTD